MNHLVPRTITRSWLEFPVLSKGDRVLPRLASRLEAAADAARPLLLQVAKGESVMAEAFWHRVLPDLLHPLSAKWLSRGDRGREKRSEEGEARRYANAKELLSKAQQVDCPIGFREDLRGAARLLCDSPCLDYRVGPVGAWPDADGTQVLFGEAGQVAERLTYLHQALRGAGLGPATRAVAACAVLLNIHPFPDGNGRSARALFSSVLGEAWQIDGVHIPMRRILEDSKGGFEIRVREAETNGNWAPLVQYFTTIFSAIEIDDAPI